MMVQNQVGWKVKPCEPGKGSVAGAKYVVVDYLGEPRVYTDDPDVAAMVSIAPMLLQVASAAARLDLETPDMAGVNVSTTVPLAKKIIALGLERADELKAATAHQTNGKAK